MRATVLFAASLVALGGAHAGAQPAPKPDPKGAASTPGKPTAASERTRTKFLKVKVSGEFIDTRLGDVLKEFAGQVDMRAGEPVMWAYGPGFPYAQKVTYSCKSKPLDAALDELFTKLGTPGYVVVSKDGDKYDGWVLLTTGGERGSAKGAEPKATPEAEEAAAKRLALVKKLIADGQTARAKPLLKLIAEKYPGTKAAAEARQLLAKLEK